MHLECVFVVQKLRMIEINMNILTVALIFQSLSAKILNLFY